MAVKRHSHQKLLLVPCVILAALLPVFTLADCSREIPVPKVSVTYRNWKRTTKLELNYPIPGHEDRYRRIFINALGERPSKDYPDGTEIVKEIYESQDFREDKIPVSLTVMIKNRSHPKARGGWLWIVKDMKSGKETVIDEEFCITCHANANERHPYGDKNMNEEFRDYIFFPFSPETP